MNSLVAKLLKSSSCRCSLRFYTSQIVPENQHPFDSLALPNEQQNELSSVETMEDTPTYFTPSFNFAAYVNKSETLQKLLQLGVDLSKIEKRKGLPQFVLKLDFERDMKNHLIFLHDLGVPAEHLGWFLTKNPLIFKESIEDMETRVFYLRAKNFTLDEVRDVVARNPYWLSFPTRRIDRRLGWFQKNFHLGGSQVRTVTLREPKLITYKMEHIRETSFSIKEEMGFTKEEVRELLLLKPKYWMNNKEDLVERFDYVHNVMHLTHANILRSPEILSSRMFRLKQRHEFLKFLGKAQYDETKPGYVSLKSFVEGTDKDFVLDVCKSSVETFDNFLKTL